MRTRTPIALVVASCLTTSVVARIPQAAAPPIAGPVFDVVSIRPTAPGSGGRPVNSTDNQRPDGGFSITNVFVPTLIARAYPIGVPADIIGLPEWTRTERFDVSTRSSLERATSEDRIAMLRAMLADRFKLAVHVEQRPQQVFELVMARGDRRLGKGLTPIEADCAAKLEADRAAAEAARAAGTPLPFQRPNLSAPPPPCTLRSVTGRPISREGGAPVMPPAHLEGETAMADLATFLRFAAGRPVVDRTGLSGSYRVAMDFDVNASRRGPDVAAPPDSGPPIFTAVQEQLGLRLQSATAVRDTLIIDRLERPTPN